jgi:hypothetical protein
VPVLFDNHLDTDFGAPRQIMVQMSKSEEIFTDKRNVKPVHDVCGGLTLPGCPLLNGAPFPMADQLINSTGSAGVPV